VSLYDNGFLRISEVYYPGWKILVDGVSVPVYRADLAWMAVAITKGEHTIEMIPQSLYLQKAEIVSYPLMLLLLLYWIGLAGFTAINQKKQKKAA
jgi:uncharacterized membrane protein YfhO